jgi:cobalt-zinc-cadmium efflux system protein
MTEPGRPEADGHGRCDLPESAIRSVPEACEPALETPARTGLRSGHSHGAGHDHGHAHGSRLTITGEHRKSLVIVLLITLSVAIAEAIGAWISGALVLFADAAHMAADVAGVGLSLLAVMFASRPPTLKRTFGYARAEILAAVANAVVLFAMSVFILA